jgi:hypothetical protein
MRCSSSSSGAFNNITGARRQRSSCLASNNFVLAFNTNDDLWAVADGWWCCAQNDQTDWVDNVATSANTSGCLDVEGPIQAALMLGDNAVVYKRAASSSASTWALLMVWRLRPVPGGEAGAVGKEAVCDIGGVHFFVGNDNFWLYDGTRPVPLGVGICASGS